MTALLDVNALIALAWPNHVHHGAVRAWFADRRQHGWATCLMTEAGFVRVSCNPSVVKHAVAPLDAIAVLERLTRLGAHEFWPLERSIIHLPESIGARLKGYRQVSDALLLDAAIRRRGQVATLDAGMESLVAGNERSSVCVIPV